MGTNVGKRPSPDKGSPCSSRDLLASHHVDRSPAPGRAVTVAEDSQVLRPTVCFVANYQDEIYPFETGSWARFGRDDLNCHIVVWEELRGSALSRTAGELWCMEEEELWVRNLSYTHELVVAGPAGPPQLLAPRNEGQRGRACSVPVPEGVISAPSTGEWQMTVRQIGRPGQLSRTRLADLHPHPDDTRTVGPVPEDLRNVAAALCAPLLTRGGQAANYEQVAAALNVSIRQARRKVEKLCQYYRSQVPDLLGPHTSDGQALYAPVAELLVARGRVSREDLAHLPPATTTSARAVE